MLCGCNSEGECTTEVADWESLGPLAVNEEGISEPIEVLLKASVGTLALRSSLILPRAWL